MKAKVKLAILIVCSTCFVTTWRLSSCLIFKAIKGTSKKVEKIKYCSCSSCLSAQDVWFMQRFDKSVNPFLTSGENMTEEDYNWWKKLQLEQGNFTEFKATTKSFYQMFPSKPDVTEPSPDRCMTCAVVGNSGNLNGSHYGKRIDAHHIVIRMNSGQTKGFEEDVGTKTTHHVMYPESAVDLDNTTHLVLFPFKIVDLQWIIEALTTGFHGTSYAPVKEKIKANKDLVMVVNPQFMRYVHKSWLCLKGQYPSTGFMTLVLAMHICDEVTVFGFGADKNGNWNHYWEALRDKNLKTGVHPGSNEYDMIQELANRKKVSFLKAWW